MVRNIQHSAPALFKPINKFIYGTPGCSASECLPCVIHDFLAAPSSTWSWRRVGKNYQGVQPTPSSRPPASPATSSTSAISSAVAPCAAVTNHIHHKLAALAPSTFASTEEDSVNLDDRLAST